MQLPAEAGFVAPPPPTRSFWLTLTLHCFTIIMVLDMWTD